MIKFLNQKLIKMKKLLLAIVVIIFTGVTVNAQSKFSIAANVGTGTYAGSKLTYGADLQVDVPASKSFKVTGSAGYENYSFKYTYGTTSGTINSGVIPVLVGGKVNLGSMFYLHGQLGYGFFTESGAGGHFAYAPSLGYSLGNKLDLSAKYLKISDLGAIVLRLALGL